MTTLRVVPLSPFKAALMLVQVTLWLPVVSAEIDSATDSMSSLFSRAQGIHIHLGVSILAAAAIIVGAVMLVFGFRLIRATLFIIGFVAGGIAIALIIERLFRDETWVVLASWIAFGVGGLICGAVVTWLYPLSTFVAGAATGIMTAMILTNSLGYLIYPGHTKALLTVTCVVLGIAFGVLTLKLGKPVLIISTSLFGSGMVVWGVGYFAGDFPSANNLEQYASKDDDGETVYFIPAAWWGYLAGIVVLFVLGMFIQFRKTARKVKYIPKDFVEIDDYVEKKTGRNVSREPKMEAPVPRRQRQVRQIREVRAQQTPSKKSSKEPKQLKVKQQVQEQQHPASPLYQRQYADLDAVDEIVEYEERMPRQKRVVYSDRESDLFEFEPSREPCRICGDYVHRNNPC